MKRSSFFKIFFAFGAALFVNPTSLFKEEKPITWIGSEAKDKIWKFKYRYHLQDGQCAIISEIELQKWVKCISFHVTGNITS